MKELNNSKKGMFEKLSGNKLKESKNRLSASAGEGETSKRHYSLGTVNQNGAERWPTSYTT